MEQGSLWSSCLSWMQREWSRFFKNWEILLQRGEVAILRHFPKYCDFPQTRNDDSLKENQVEVYFAGQHPFENALARQANS